MKPAVGADNHAVGQAGEVVADAPRLAVAGLLRRDEAADGGRQDADDALAGFGVVVPDGGEEGVVDLDAAGGEENMEEITLDEILASLEEADEAE